MAEVKAKMFAGERVCVCTCKSNYTGFIEADQEIKPLFTSTERVTLPVLTHFTPQLWNGKCCKARREMLQAQVHGVGSVLPLSHDS